MSLRNTDSPADEELIKLKRKFKLHLADFEDHKKREDKALNALVASTEQNTIAITTMSRTMEEHIKTTQGVIEVYNTANALQRFFKWLSGFGIVVALLTFSSDIMTYLTDKFHTS